MGKIINNKWGNYEPNNDEGEVKNQKTSFVPPCARRDNT